MLTVGSLFSGIGGIELGLEMTGGFKTIWQCESDSYARKVLAKHWPDVPIYEDVRLIDESVERPDMLCGGFPCQDISVANTKGDGLEGKRSGLWFEFYRAICLLRPRYVLVENVANLVNKGLDRILGQMAEVGYHAEWQVLSAAQFGAWHLRKRLFIIAYASGNRSQKQGNASGLHRTEDIGRAADNVGASVTNETDVSSPTQLQRHDCHDNAGISAPSETVPEFGNGGGQETLPREFVFPEQFKGGYSWWKVERAFCRVFNGIPTGLDFNNIPNRTNRLRCLGNAVVPQCAEYVGNLILERDAACQFR